MSKMKEGKSRLQRKIAGHKTTVKLLLIMVIGSLLKEYEEFTQGL